MSSQLVDNGTLPTKLVIRIDEAASILGIAKSTIWARANPKSTRYDPDFPTIFPLHSNPSGKGAVGIYWADLDQYVRTRRDLTRISDPRSTRKD